MEDEQKTTEKQSSLFSRECLDKCTFKFLFYSIYAAFGATLTFLPLYFKQLGLNAAQVGLLTGVRPFIQLVGAPLAGCVADKYKKRKLVAVISLLAFMVKHLGIFLVEHPQKTCLKMPNSTNQLSNITENIIHKREMMVTLYKQPWIVDTDYKARRAHHTAMDTTRTVNSNEPEMTKRRNAELHQVISHQERQKKSAAHRLEKRKRHQRNSNTSHQNYTSRIVTDQTDLNSVFIKLFVIIAICELFGSSFLSLADAGIVEILGDARNDFGKYRLWGSVGLGSSALIIGAVLQKNVYYFCETLEKKYSIMFYFLFGFGCLALIPLICSKQIYSDVRENLQSGMSKLKGLFCNMKNISFWVAIICLAILDGFQMDFGPWFLDDLGTSSLMVGVATAAHFAVSACTYMISPYVINKLGYMLVLSIGLFLHAVMFVMFSFAKTSWFAVVLFSSVGFVSSLSWSCGITYIAMVSTPLGIVSTGEGFFSGIYTGIGISFGTIVGGVIIKVIGIRTAFRMLAGFSVLMLVIFNIFLLIDKKLTTQTDSSYEPINTVKESDDEQ